jgi:hypothetical protein
MKKLLFLAIMCSINSLANAQVKKLSYSFTNMTSMGINAPAISGTYLFSMSKKRDTHFKIGLGARLTHIRGGFCKSYITAPAILTSGKTGPAVFFAEQIEANIDTISLDRTRATAVNLLGALNYRINSKLSVEFNIDLVGFSFGAAQKAYLRNALGIDNVNSFDNAKPTSTNATLISDNDRGNLNSEFAISYKINSNWKAKLGAGFLFTEYSLEKPNYTNLSGTSVANDRFRNKSLGFSYGVIYNF